MADTERATRTAEERDRDSVDFAPLVAWLRRRRILHSAAPPQSAPVDPAQTVVLDEALPAPLAERPVVTVAVPFQHWDWAPDADSRPIERDLQSRFILVAATVAYIWLFSYWTTRHHDGFGTQAFDFGIYDQGLWLLSQFKTPFITIMGRHLFGDHTSFILLPLVPVYWVIPSAKVLLVAQAAALGSAAIPTFLLAREKLRNEWLATVLAVVYLLHPAVAFTNLEQFHPDVFEVPLALFALWFMVRHRWRGYFMCVVALLLVKEDVALLTFPLGIYVAFRHDRRVGVATCLLSVVSMAAALFWILPMYNGIGSLNSWRVPFGGLGGFFRTALLHPGKLITYLSQDGRPWYVWQMFAPFAWLPVLAPRVLLIGVPPLASNVLSTFWYQYHIKYHYGTLIIPVLVASTIFAISKLRSLAGRQVAVGLVAAAALVTAHLWGPTPLGRNEAAIASPNGESVPHLKTAMAMIPDDAVVSAFYGYVPHVDHREEIYMFPNPFQASYWGTFKQEGQRLPQADRVEYVFVPTVLDPEPQAIFNRIRVDFHTVYEAGNVTLLKRKPPAPPA